MIACANPCYSSSNHTINTLRYSDRLKEKTKSSNHSNNNLPNVQLNNNMGNQNQNPNYNMNNNMENQHQKYNNNMGNQNQNENQNYNVNNKVENQNQGFNPNMVIKNSVEFTNMNKDIDTLMGEIREDNQTNFGALGDMDEMEVIIYSKL